ncbi:hypothetical protein, partial [Rhodovulum sp.]|uniref:hypothetical protein n=1 Tax=Rhodovulum sp. TaxID=34009 RepID=UPI00257E0C63
MPEAPSNSAAEPGPRGLFARQPHHELHRGFIRDQRPAQHRPGAVQRQQNVAAQRRGGAKRGPCLG